VNDHNAWFFGEAALVLWLVASNLNFAALGWGNNHILGSPRRLPGAGYACSHSAIKVNLRRRFQLPGFHNE